MISFFISAIFCFYSIYQDHLSKERIENLFYSPYIYLSDATVDPTQLYEELNILSEKYDASIIKTEIANNIVYKAGIYRDDYFNTLNLTLSSGQLPLSNEILATFNTGDPLQSGIISDPFEDDPIVFTSLSNLSSEPGYSISGKYTIVSSQANELIEELAHFLNIDPASLYHSTYQRSFSDGMVLILSVITLILSLIFILMCIYYPISQIQEIAVMRLNGQSLFDIWNILYKPIDWIILAGALLNPWIISLLFRNVPLNFYLTLEGIQGLFCIISFVMSLITLYFIEKTPIHLLLKGIASSKAFLILSYLIKAISVCAIVFLLIPTVKEGTKLINEYSALELYKQQANSLTLASYTYTGNEFQSMLNGDNVFGKKLMQFFMEIEKTANAQYVDVEITDSEFNRNMKDILSLPDISDQNLYFYNINSNYLSENAPVLRKKIKSYFEDTPLKILVPQESFNDSVLMDYIQKVSKLWNPNANEIEYLPYSESLSFFSENIHLIDQGITIIENPILVCLNQNYFGLDNSAIYNPIRIQNTESNIQAIQEAIARNGLQNNDLIFASVYESGLQERISGYSQEVTIFVTLLIMGIGASFLSSWALVLIILSLAKKEIAVKTLLGYGIFEKYREIFLVYLSIYLLGAFIIFINFSWSTLTIYGLIAMTDLLFFRFMIGKEERKLLAETLKGK